MLIDVEQLPKIVRNVVIPQFVGPTLDVLPFDTPETNETNETNKTIDKPKITPEFKKEKVYVKAKAVSQEKTVVSGNMKNTGLPIGALLALLMAILIATRKRKF